MTDDATDGNDATQDVVPRIDLRVPGPWSGPEELNAVLKKKGLGYELTENAFVRTGGSHAGRRFEWGVTAPDDEIADIFAHTGRLKAAEVDAIRRHACKFHLMGPGGSVEAAREMMRAGTALVKAGGAGVMVDNSAAAHGPRDWLKLAADREPGGLYWAYVVAAGAAGEDAYTVGMHCLGLRDAELEGCPDMKLAGFILHNFLGYTYQSGATVLDGDRVGGPDGPQFTARHYPCGRFRVGTPQYNPYGVWRLEPVL